MKQGTKFTMPISFEELNLEEVETIEIIFKRTQNKSDTAIKKVVYPSDTALSEDGQILISWTKEETYQVPTNSRFYMDTRVHLKDSSDMPETPIVSLLMNPTLFNVEE